MREIHAQNWRGYEAAQLIRCNASRSGSPTRARVLCLDEFFVSDIADAMLLSGPAHRPIRARCDARRRLRMSPPQESVPRRPAAPAFPAGRSTLLERHMEVVQVDGGIDYRLREAAAGTDLPGIELNQTRRARTRHGVSPRWPALCREAHRRVPHPARCRSRCVSRIARFAREACVARHRMVRLSRNCAKARAARTTTSRLRASITPSSSPTYRCSPTLSDDAARRFIMLIDEFYDRNGSTL